jgi:hypothetical protein
MYQLYKTFSGEEGVLNMETNTSFLLSGNSVEKQEYLRWLEAGNTPTPAEENQ